MIITIRHNGQPVKITLTKEQIAKLPTPKFEWRYPTSEKTFKLSECDISREWSGEGTQVLEHGRYRTTLEQAEASLLRNKRANRLEALVYQLQDKVEGSYCIYKHLDVWGFADKHKDTYYPDVVLMLKSTAKTICSMLNNNEFRLDGEL